MPSVIIENLSVSYKAGKKGKVEALRNVSLTFSDAEFHAVIGPSGSGKTTLLRSILGQVDYSGSILLNDIDIANLTLPERNLSYVSQNYVLYPSMTVFDNIAFPLKMAGASREDIIARVEAVATELGIHHCLSRRIRQLSGGQQQRIALARALIKKPSLLLFDEPLSNLDVPERASARLLIKKLALQNHITAIYVTHELQEALALGDDVFYLEKGQILYEGTPQEMAQSHDPLVEELLKDSSL